MEIIYLVIGLVVGAAAGWLIAAARAKSQSGAQATELQRRADSAEAVVVELRKQQEASAAAVQGLQRDLDGERQAAVRAQTQLAESQRNLQEQRALLDDARIRLTEAFKAVSSDALKTNNQMFLDLARKSFEAVLADARGDLGKKQEAIDSLVRPLAASLAQYEQHVRTLEATRVQAYTSIEEHLKSLAATHVQLQKETGSLVTALRTPAIRGRWGEVTLHRVVELAGMSEHCDYAEQISVDTDDGRLRPDMVVHLPSHRDIVVDSKCSLEAYLQAVSAGTEAERAAFLAGHAQQIRTHMQQLSGKEYWKQFDKTPEFVVMFIPGESFFAAALDCDPSLLEDGMKQRVVLATPTTLVALLRAVAYGWQQEQITENAQAMLQLGKELVERVKTFRAHLVNVGVALVRTVRDYNNAVGSLETRVLPTVRKFQEMGVGGDALPTAEPLDVTPRSLSETEDREPKAEDRKPESPSTPSE